MNATVPAKPKIYHLTHIDNLPGIVRDAVLWSDAKRIHLAVDSEIVGMASIKQRRLKLPVKCHPGTSVGQYVPFYFCPRSIMLYILHMGNHPDLTYQEGQEPIVHLMADLRATVEWAQNRGRRWAFSTCNAGARYAEFYADLSQLDKINWEAVHASDFRDPETKDGKQAEFLIYESFPWKLVEAVGVWKPEIKSRTGTALGNAAHCPVVAVEPSWYY
jgi:hypothetical protein